MQCTGRHQQVSVGDQPGVGQGLAGRDADLAAGRTQRQATSGVEHGAGLGLQRAAVEQQVASASAGRTHAELAVALDRQHTAQYPGGTGVEVVRRAVQRQPARAGLAQAAGQAARR